MTELSWGILLAGYLFLGGLSGGSYIVGALIDLVSKEKQDVLSKTSILASFVSIILGLILLIMDLGRFRVDPLGMLNAYNNYPASIMTIGTWVITIFAFVSLITSLLWYLDGNVLVRKIFEIAGVVLGFATCAYTGLLLSFSRGVPFWNSGFLPWLFVLSGILTGLALGVLLVPILAELMPKAFTDCKKLWGDTIQYVRMIEYTDRLAQIAVLMEFIVMLLYFITTPATYRIWSGSSVSMHFYLYILLALLIPLGITIYNPRLRQENKLRPMMFFTLLACVFALVGGFLLRYVILIGGQIV